MNFDRQGIADHAQNLAKNIQGSLKRSLEALGVDILNGNARLNGPHKLSYGLPGRIDVGGDVTAKDIILATGSVPFVPPGHFGAQFVNNALCRDSDRWQNGIYVRSRFEAGLDSSMDRDYWQWIYRIGIFGRLHSVGIRSHFRRSFGKTHARL